MHNTHSIVKPQNAKATVKRLLNYLKPQKKILLIVMAMAILSAIADIFIPKVLALATNEIAYNFANINFGYLLKVLACCLVLYLLSASFLFISNFSAAKMTQQVVYNLRSDMKLKLDKLPISYFDNSSRGDVLSRVTNDIDTIAGTLQESLTQLIFAFVTITGVLIMMLVTNIWMTLVTIATVPILLLITMIVATKSKKLFAKQQKELGVLNGHVEEMYGGHQVIKLYGREDESQATFAIINNRLADAGFKAQGMSSIIMPLMNFVGNLAYIGLCVLGGSLVGKPNLGIGNVFTIGTIQEFFMYRNKFTQPINQLANITNIIQSTIVASERVFEIFDAEEEINVENKEIDHVNAQGNVEFEDVSFSYNKDVELIADLNLVVNSGESVAIVGPTGAGKTTLVNLLMRFYDIDKGRIIIDGVDINDYSRNELRELFAMVLQDTWLFTGTIRDNIAYGLENATDEDVMNAAKSAHAHHFIMATADGYNTVINEEAGNISQGQKQLLTIARAILKNSKVLILDEATSSVDTRTEQYIQTAMTQMMEGKTSFVIAHRLSTIKSASKILVMNNGHVVEQGNHEELLKKGGFYAELYNAQLNKNANDD